MPFSLRSWGFDIDHYLNRIIPPSPLPNLPYPIAHWFGYRKIPPKDVGNIIAAFFAFVGAFAGLLTVAGLFDYTGIRHLGGPVLIASFGASAILEYNALSSPLAQPRNTLLGHTLSAIIGVGITKLFALCHYPSFSATTSPPARNLSFVPAALACALSSAAMLLTNTVHPPGGASAVLAATVPEVVEMGWAFVGLAALGSVVMTLVGLVTNNMMRRYPVYWWTPDEVGRKRRRDMDEEKREDVEQGVDVRRVMVTTEELQMPEWLVLSVEEAVVLESLRQRLRDRIGMLEERILRAIDDSCEAVQSQDSYENGIETKKEVEL